MSDVSLRARPGVDTDRLLRLAAVLFAGAVVLHNGDHLRRGGDSVSAQVFWLGGAAIILEVAVVALVLGRHPSAPLAALTVGFSLAVGYVVVHFTPGRPFLSDSLVDGGAQIVSIVAASLETITALALGLAGLASIRGQGMTAAAEGPTPSAAVVAGLRQPFVATFAIANVLIFALSLAGR